VIFLPKRWREQPQGPVTVNWSHPIANGLIVGFIPGANSTNAYGNDKLASSSYASFGKANGGLINGNAQPAGRFVLKNSIFTGPITVGMCGVLNRTSGGFLNPLGGTVGGSLSVGFELQPSTLDVLTQVYDPGYNTSCDISAGVSFAEVKRTRFFSSTYSVAASGAYLGGKLLAASSTPFFPDNLIEPLGEFQFGGKTTAIPERGFASGFFVWTRVLSDAERATLDENPWQLFMPQRPAKKTYPVGAPLVLSANAGAYNINGYGFVDFPPASDVRSGVTFGPGGIYVGTLTAGGKPIFIFDD
jgi:hypothetical protein